MNRKELEKLAKTTVNKCFEVHTNLGPGLLEKTYEICLRLELDSIGIESERQAQMHLRYRKAIIEDAYRLDLFVEESLIVEVKAVERLLPVHKAQLLTYLRTSDIRLGVLVNFNTPRLKGNVKRVVNNL